MTKVVIVLNFLCKKSMVQSKEDYARIIIEHLNETQPGVLAILAKDDIPTLKYIVDSKVKEAIKLNTRYIETTDLSQIEINELVNDFIAPAEDLPDEAVDELDPIEIEKILELIK